MLKSEQPGVVHTYRCKACGWQMVTITAEEGLIPGDFPCNRVGDRTKNLCLGRAVMRRPDRSDNPTHEWFRPTEQGMLLLSAKLIAYVSRGGLLLREIEPTPAQEEASNAATN